MNSGPFILSSGTFLAVGTPVPAASRLRGDEAFRFNSGITHSDIIDLLQRGGSQFALQVSSRDN